MEHPICNLKTLQRNAFSEFVYDDSYVIPDQSMTIGDMVDRNILGQSISDHSDEAILDDNFDEPLRYDTDLTDVKTPYQDKEYLDDLHRRAHSISSGSIDPNPNNLNHEKVSSSPVKSVSSDSSSGKDS